MAKATSSRKSTFVFQGTVLKLGAATMRTVPVDDNTAIVHVEQVLEAPQNLSRYAGRDITVQLAARGKAAVGHQFVFHTAGWMFGDSIAVRAEKQEPVRATRSAAQPMETIQFASATTARCTSALQRPTWSF